MRTIVEELQQWYYEQCDGEWEHNYGVSINTLDNPGWHVKIEVKDTFNHMPSSKYFNKETDENNWIACRFDGKTFEGNGDQFKHVMILSIFLK